MSNKIYTTLRDTLNILAKKHMAWLIRCTMNVFADTQDIQMSQESECQKQHSFFFNALLSMVMKAHSVLRLFICIQFYLSIPKVILERQIREGESPVCSDIMEGKFYA